MHALIRIPILHFVKWVWWLCKEHINIYRNSGLSIEFLIFKIMMQHWLKMSSNDHFIIAKPRLKSGYIRLQPLEIANDINVSIID